MSRFEEGSQEAINIMNKLIENQFSYLSNATIEVVFDTKKRKSKGQYVLGRLQKANDLMKYLSSSNIYPDGIDYILYLDKNVFESLNENDKKRIIFHELCHAEMDAEASDPWKLKDHEFAGFYSELDYNRDDPRWSERIGAVAQSIYEDND